MTTMNNLVFKGQNNQALTNSLLVAEKFGKNHKDVIEVITSILVKAENSAQTDNQQLAKMFALIEYDVPLNNGTGAVRKAPMYVMNRDGFTLLAMGFTGEKALKFKLDYINAFNQMEETIKNGGHHVPGSFREALLLAAEQQARIEEQQKMIEANRPKVLFAEAVETSQRSCLIGELAKILNQNGIEIGQNRLFQWLRDNGYLCKTGENYNLPTQRAMEMNLFEIKKTTINKPDGTILVTTTTKVTGKGQIYFINKFLREKQQKQAV
ncbi:Rha family transcriptional regulator [Barnesiella intestinihominis]|uniref:Rha family transcriptional regulator n=1 Tax=Barnesiella intestinihominis TaxID=487174 RepID=UPI003AB56AF8